MRKYSPPKNPDTVEFELMVTKMMKNRLGTPVFSCDLHKSYDCVFCMPNRRCSKDGPCSYAIRVS